ncbi:hypothetical protein DPMN_026804 [Dreissena polymorpha]|uniref:Uncharacterized protein n=1 Tax=Dreissena polymorpha TaxID=45954 RepID=A0A9D4RD31_DREPO|nr:hypothetical protein DPMN_026804 [Dreissena polymorpha]
MFFYSSWAWKQLFMQMIEQTNHKRLTIPASGHKESMTAAFKGLETHGLKLKGSTCEFFKSSVTYLGHIISEQGIAKFP